MCRTSPIHSTNHRISAIQPSQPGHSTLRALSVQPIIASRSFIHRNSVIQPLHDASLCRTSPLHPTNHCHSVIQPLDDAHVCRTSPFHPTNHRNSVAQPLDDAPVCRTWSFHPTNHRNSIIQPLHQPCIQPLHDPVQPTNANFTISRSLYRSRDSFFVLPSEFPPSDLVPRESYYPFRAKKRSVPFFSRVQTSQCIIKSSSPKSGTAVVTNNINITGDHS